ncbi:phosphatase PAP2 family protein [Paenarthrobacter nicotinovorans]|uniref:phosphatase PAP2 family protein n=1 Tax=Paenarthrobacter nicotinovorans TaxID=29320 RepID=UPI0011A52943|nr:phosphatase PAP2 family protein [Paenarthrobacter nicotinovorans]
MNHHPDGPPPREEETSADDRTVGSRDLTRWKTPAGRALASWVQRLSFRLGRHGALILMVVAGAVIAGLLTAVAGEVYEAVAESDGVAALDRPVLDAVKRLRSPAVDAAVTGYSALAGETVLPVVALVAIIILTLRQRTWTPFVLIVIAGAGSLFMTVVGKQLIGRARPPLVDAVPPFEYSPSFPSGHTLNSFVIAGIIAYLILLRGHSLRVRASALALAAGFAVTIGLSRVFLGHHWLTDVLVAWTLGAAWLAIVITVHRLHLTLRRKS